MHNFNKIRSGHVCLSTLLKFCKYQEDNIRPKTGGQKRLNIILYMIKEKKFLDEP
jgi:hypothetical protein